MHIIFSPNSFIIINTTLLKLQRKEKLKKKSNPRLYYIQVKKKRDRLYKYYIYYMNCKKNSNEDLCSLKVPFIYKKKRQCVIALHCPG